MKKEYFKIIWKDLELSITIVGLVLSILLALIPIVIKCNLVQIITSCSLGGLFFLIYFIIAFVKYHNYKETKKISIKFGDSKVNIYYGDIFSVDNDGYKVIAFNEYFDTITDDHLHVIDKNSLHGIYLNKFYPNDISRDNFHKRVEDSMKEFKTFENKKRKIGYNQAYEWGALFEDNDYLLMSFTKFDEYNRAHVKYSEMITSFIKMWFNIDKVKGTRKVYLPLIGSGITRFDDGDVSNNEILLSMIETFKISRVKFKHPANVNIILYGKNLDIDLVLIKNKYNGKVEK